ncbi:MAG: substrate-binding domain-containing protein [Rhodothermaceae bacterium]|nr:substrate-binding domain-containing protein [Rhodothermaceae bacterium]
MRNLYRLLPVLMLALAVSSCQTQPQSDAVEATTGTIGVTLLTMTHPFFQNLAAGLEEAAGEHNMAVTVNSAEFDVARQRNQIADFIVQGVDAIVMSPADSKAIVTAIQEANEAGIPVFTADIAALADGVEIVTHIATDNYSGGRLAAEAVLEIAEEAAEIAIIDHPEVESVIQRTKGFHDVINEANTNGKAIEVVAQLPGGGIKDRAFRVAEDILQAHPNLDVIFAINDDTALGAVAAIEKAGKSGTVQVVGFDGTAEARRAILEGKIYADVIQHPHQIGIMTVESIVSYMNGDDLPPEQLIPATLYRQADAAADPILQEEAASE